MAASPAFRSRSAVLTFVAAVVFVVSAAFTPADPPAPAVELKVVDYSELCREVRALKGKVVVVDVWGEFCLPCKKAFPDLVKMHQRFAKDGLVCVSVSVDPTEKKEAAKEFLKSQSAAFPNYLLAEKPAVWQDKWDINGPPALLVFNRKNQRVAKFDSNDPDKTYTHEDVEKVVRQLLDETP
jgi:thiol-disulfide isomerase/thioredoxin